MLTNESLKLHFHPKKGWMNDPNGLCEYKGRYHIFFQHAPEHETPWGEPMVWGHAVTSDFIEYQELPVALKSDAPYDMGGVWSGTAAEHDGDLYLFYASVSADQRQTISVAVSHDGMTFEKYPGNPIIREYPSDGSRDFRDPAILLGEKEHYLVIASADTQKKTGNLLLYRSKNLFDWEYAGVLHEYADCRFCECPSFVRCGDGYILSVSVVRNDGSHFFEVLYGDFDGSRFSAKAVSHFQHGPDEYAGQIFHDAKGRNIMMSWIPGWSYQPKEKCIGCLSIPLEIGVSDGKITAYPIKELQAYVKDDNTLTDAYILERYSPEKDSVSIELLEKP